jgi:H+/Cl- antiporter ClcA
MITDRTTARVLGVVVLFMAVLIDTTCFLFARPETRQNPRFAVVVLVSSVPMFVIGALLWRKGSRMRDDRNDD